MIDTGDLADVQDALGEATVAGSTEERTQQYALHALSLLMDACCDDASYAGFWCPKCDWFRIGLVSGDLDVCRDCGTVLEEKVLIKTTVFDNARRTSARVIDG